MGIARGKWSLGISLLNLVILVSLWLVYIWQSTEDPTGSGPFVLGLFLLPFTIVGFLFGILEVMGWEESSDKRVTVWGLILNFAFLLIFVLLAMSWLLHRHVSGFWVT